MKKSKIAQSRSYVIKSFCIALIGIICSCNEMMLGEEPQNTPIQNFEVLWNEFDQMYGLFEVKNVDWQQIHQEFAPQVTHEMDDEELFGILSQVLGKLNDGHVWMVKPAPNFKRYDSGPHYPTDDFDLRLVRSKLAEEKHIGNSNNPDVLYGKFEGNIGYVYLENLGMMPGFYQKALEEIIHYLKNTDGLIFDARGIEGGDDRSAQAVAGFFALENRLYMTTRFRNGKNHNDFTEPFLWKTIPSSTSRYSGNVAMLTNRQTGSAGETFVLAMKTIDKVVVMGDSTYGAFSDNPKRELPNGWIYSISTGDFRDASGVSFEGIGIEPDIYIKNTAQEIQQNVDRTLEEALKILRD